MKRLSVFGIALAFLLLFTIVLIFEVKLPESRAQVLPDYDFAQSLAWSQTYGGTEDEDASSLIQTEDGGYVVGASNEIIKIDAAGGVEWNKALKSSGSTYVVQTSDGGYAIAKTNMSDPPPGIAPDLEFLLIKIDANGNEQWYKTYGGYKNQYVNCLIQTSDGGYALAGDTYAGGPLTAWLVKTDVNGNMEWNKRYGVVEYTSFESVIQTSDGGYALAGFNAMPVGGMSPGAWLVKTDAAGNVEWNRTFGEIGSKAAYDVVQTLDGGYALATTNYTTTVANADALFIKVDLAGSIEWYRTFGGSARDDLRSLIQTIEGGFALAGSTNSSGLGQSDGWLVKTDAIGIMEWSKTFGGVENDDFQSLVQTVDEGYALVGSTESTGKGGSDAWLVKIPPDLAYPQMGFEVLNGGSGYTTPAVIFADGGGAGAAATSRVSNGVIKGILLTNPGTGYANVPITRIIDPNPRATGVIIIITFNN